MPKDRKLNPPNSQSGGSEAQAPSAPQEAQVSPEQSGSVTASPTEAVAEAQPVNDTPINIIGDEPVVQTAVFEDAPDPAPVEASHGLSDADFYKLHAEATNENDKEDFRQRILDARMQPAPSNEPPPAHPRILEQTNAELEAGKALVAKNEAMRAARSPNPVNTVREGTMTEVFRPANHVPDPKKPVLQGASVLRG